MFSIVFSKDDDIFDNDLPVEPLEVRSLFWKANFCAFELRSQTSHAKAPDEGPEVFEGETILPELDMYRP